jgi:hypothetical protein
LAALDLHYLFTFYGDDATLVPQRLLGAVVSTLQAQPLLSTKNIQDAEAALGGVLAGSGLENQVERVRFTPTALSLEEFSKLWSVFFQVEYSLSVAYQASVVLIESDLTPQQAPPVMVPNLYVLPFQWPQINQVVSQAGAGQPIVTGTTLLIQGQQLRGQTTLVLIEGQELTPAGVTDTQITLPVPATIHAGVQGLQVLQKLAMGTPPVPHRSVESNVVPFVLRPTLSTSSAAVVSAAGAATKVTNVTLNLVPNIGVGQRAVLLLNNVSGSSPASYTSAAVTSTADTPQIVVPIENVPTGTYLARVQINGSDSVLTVDPTTNQFTGPTVTMP